MKSARHALLAKVHLGKKALGLDEDTYRALLRRVVGVDSAGTMTHHQLELVLGEMRRAGWQDTPRQRDTRTPQEKMIRALWAQLAKAGLLRAGNDRAALRSFVQRQTGVADTAWLSPEQATKVIEALKAMLARGAS